MTDWRYSLSASGLGHAEKLTALEFLTADNEPGGRQVRALEPELAEVCGTKHAIAVDNGPAALHLALLAAEIGQSPGDEVIQPSLNTPSSANMTVAAGALPVFADIASPLEPTLDPDQASSLIGPNTKAVVAAHYGGYPAQMAALEDLCRTHKLLLIEQSDHAPVCPAPGLVNGPSRTGRYIGCFTLGASLSDTWSNGGVVVTNDGELAARIRSVLWRSSTTLSAKRDTRRTSAAEVMAHGFNYRMNDLNAAISRAQLKTISSGNTLRQKRAQAYANVVETFCDGAIEYVFGFAPQAGAAHVAAILVEPSMRDDVRAFLTDNRVQTSLHCPPLHKLSAFAEAQTGGLPQTNTFAERVILLPIHADLPMMAPEHIVRLAMTHLTGRRTAQPDSTQNDLKVA